MIGIDVGGANLKVVDDEGAHIIYAPLWEGQAIADLLLPFREKGEKAAVVMSGELADCFQSKNEGIAWIVHEIQKVFPEAVFFGTDGVFHNRPEPCLAAANWLASAMFLEHSHEGWVLLDFGSTTTDIIPLSDVRGMYGYTDLRRLQEGFLIYSGLLRTSIPMQISSVVINGIVTPLSREHFANSADAHLLLGHISQEEYTVPPPDMGEKTIEGAKKRIARCACSDVEEIGDAGCTAIARALWESQRTEILRGVALAQKRCTHEGILITGIGGRLFSDVPGSRDLSRDSGSCTDAFPAYAVRELAG